MDLVREIGHASNGLLALAAPVLFHNKTNSGSRTKFEHCLCNLVLAACEVGTTISTETPGMFVSTLCVYVCICSVQFAQGIYCLSSLVTANTKWFVAFSKHDASGRPHSECH